MISEVVGPDSPPSKIITLGVVITSVLGAANDEHAPEAAPPTKRTFADIRHECERKLARHEYLDFDKLMREIAGLRKAAERPRTREITMMS